MWKDSVFVPFGTPLREKTGDIVDLGDWSHYLNVALNGDAATAELAIIMMALTVTECTYFVFILVLPVATRQRYELFDLHIAQMRQL
jgi:hypothetical protein